MPTLVQDIENFLVAEKAKLSAALEADWTVLKPALENVGKTIESDVLTAASVFITSGGNFAQALLSITSQIPNIEASLEAAIAGLLTLKIAGLKAAPATAAVTA